MIRQLEVHRVDHIRKGLWLKLASGQGQDSVYHCVDAELARAGSDEKAWQNL